MKKLKKILLIQPNLRWANENFKTFWEIIPYNLCLLVAVIEKEYKNYDVTILDANIDNLSHDEFKEKIVETAPDLVGITLLTSEYAQAAHTAASLIKAADAECTVVLGGVYATTCADKVLDDNNIDYAVLGEGEYIFPKLLDHLNGCGDMPAEGVGYRKSGNKVLKMACIIEDLNQIPLPAYHKIDFMRYANTRQRISIDAPREMPCARVRTSRGCPIGCSFCQVEAIAGKTYRPRSIPNVIEELSWLKEEYGIKTILFNDDNLILNKKRSKELFRAMIDAKLGLKWLGTAISVFCLDEEMLDLIKESGCQYIDVAIESGVERILKDVINKPVNLDHARKMIEKIKEFEIDTAANFVIGFPGETWDEIRQTMRFAEEIDVDYVKIFIATPLPQTKLYDIALEQDALLIDKDVDKDVELNWSASRIISDEFSSNDLAILRAYEWDRINFGTAKKREKAMKMMGISEKELKELRKKTRDSVL